jgi:FkbM family methyltransferase
MYPLEKFIGKYMPTNPVIIEAGTHNGGDAIYMSRIWPQGKIYTFEPNPGWHTVIRNTIDPYPNIHFFPVALGDRNGESDFFECTSEKSGADSTLRPILTDTFWTVDLKERNHKFAKPIKVPMISLDTWAEENNIQNIDFMWLDMQGAEGNMLRGCPKILQKTRIIQTEYSTRPVYEGSMNFDELIKFLSDRGFILNFVERQNSNDVQGNALFVKIK